MSDIYEDLANTLDCFLEKGQGILAADESHTTIGKRFESIGIENTEENRRDYRLLLATTPDLEQYINGVILFEETLDQTDSQGNTIPEIFAEKGILPGIKVDKGLVALPFSESEKITQGLDGLSDRLKQYKNKGAVFAKWRNVYRISDSTPSIAAIKAGSEVLARYAAICQSLGVLPIVEPEVLMEGNHTIESCAEVTDLVLFELFQALYTHQVDFDLMLLKPNMITCGKDNKKFSLPEEVAEYTLSVFRDRVPASVPSINFLSGGQSPAVAAMNLNAINLSETQKPWLLSFSFGRALQDECLKIWSGHFNNVKEAQKALLRRAHLNSDACHGKYNAQDE
jgi:fructose-bisphosphate aldolase class I